MKPLARRAAVRLATSDRFEHAVLAVPRARSFAFRRATRYVAGTDEEAALRTIRALASRGLHASVDLFGENVTDRARIEVDTNGFLALAERLAEHPAAYLSLDCSHLGLDLDPADCRDRVARIARALPEGSRLQLGAEQSARADAILNIAHALAGNGLPIMATIQANLRRSPTDIEGLAAAGIPIRLVKGAYAEPPGVAHPWGTDTDRAYIGLARQLDRLGADYALATHDPAILAELVAGQAQRWIEFLLGVRSDEAERLAREGHHVRIYVPYGERWFRYYARRVAESIGA